MATQTTFDFEHAAEKLGRRIKLDLLCDIGDIACADTAEIFPITVMRVKVGVIEATGWAICNTHDVYDPNIGKHLALSRALRLLKKKLARRKHD